jgi:hypothetical protein
VEAVALPAIVAANSAANRFYLPRPGPLDATAGSRKGTAMKRRSFVGGLSAATLATGLLLVGSTPASAQKTEPASAKLVIGSTDVNSHTGTVRPPVLLRPRFTCHDSGAIVVVKLRNPNKTVLFFEVRLPGGEVSEALPVMLPARGFNSVEFHGIPNGRYLIELLNDAGDFVAETQVRVRCKVKPPVS